MILRKIVITLIVALIYYFVLVDSLAYLFHSFQFEILHIFMLLVHFIQIIFISILIFHSTERQNFGSLF